MPSDSNCHIMPNCDLSIINLNCLFFNAQGLKSKINHLSVEMSSLDKLPDIIAICETWCDESIIFYDNIFQSYDIYRHDRNRHGGGVLILVANICALQNVS